MGTHPWQRGGRRIHDHVAVTIPVFRRGGADPRAAEEGAGGSHGPRRWGQIILAFLAELESRKGIDGIMGFVRGGPPRPLKSLFHLRQRTHAVHLPSQKTIRNGPRKPTV